MDATWIKSRIAAHVMALAGEIGPRPCGSPANRLATDYLRMVLTAAGLRIDEQPFTCAWWEPGVATLQVGGAWIDVPPAPFSRPCDVRGRVTRLDDDAALAAAVPRPGRIVVIGGALAAEPYVPRAFPLPDRPEQRQRLERLEALEPAAVVVVVPAWRIVPVFEDGDLGFPYVSVPTNIADRLREDREVAVRITGSLRDGTGVNVAARSGGDERRLVLCAHVDTKVTTPGAFDNAGGVATLVALAEAGLPPDVPIELVFFNGEDHFQSPGERAWLATTDLDEVRSAVNIDGAGVLGHDTAVAMLACPPATERRVQALVDARPGWVVGAPWDESDHAIFATHGIPGIAITSAGAHELANVIHSERDQPRMVDPGILASVAGFLEDWLAGAAQED